MRIPKVALLLLLAASLTTAAPLSPVKLEVNTRVMGEARTVPLAAGLEAPVALIISRYAQRIAWKERDDAGTCLVVDGIRSKPYTGGVSFEGFTRDGQHVAFKGMNASISGCVITVQGEYFVVDGVEYEFPKKGGDLEVQFSADRSQMAYTRQQGEKICCVYNGKPGPTFDQVLNLALSPDGNKIAYYARRGANWFLVTDNATEIPLQQMPLHPQITFSRNSQCLAYFEKLTDGTHRFVINGAPQPSSPAIGHFELNGDGTRYFSVIHAETPDNPRIRVMIDGLLNPEIDGLVESPLFSPDGRRLLQEVKRDGKEYVVLDDQEGPAYDEVTMGRFSPDSRHVMYQATRGKQQAIVIDGKITEWYDRVSFHMFSPDSRHSTYIAEEEGKWMMVLDGQEGRKYDNPSYMRFSPDGAHNAYAATRDKQAYMVYDGQEGPAYDQIKSFYLAFSPDSAHYAYPAQKGASWVMVLDGKAGPEYAALCKPVFSPDNRLLAYLAKRENAWVPVINGVEGTALPGELLDDESTGYGFDPTGAFYYVLKQPGKTNDTVQFVRVAVTAR